MPWSDRAKRRAYQQQYIAQLKHTLLTILGGECEDCGLDVLDLLTVDHMDGRGYHVRKLSSTARWARYAREYLAGVKLRALCHDCNSRRNNPYGVKADGGPRERVEVWRLPNDPVQDREGEGRPEGSCTAGEPKRGKLLSLLRAAGGEARVDQGEDEGVDSVPF